MEGNADGDRSLPCRLGHVPGFRRLDDGESACFSSEENRSFFRIWDQVRNARQGGPVFVPCGVRLFENGSYAPRGKSGEKKMFMGERDHVIHAE